MKKYTALFLALLMCFGLLAGCAKDPAVTPDPTPTPTPTPTPDNPNPTPTPTPDPVKPAEPKIYLMLSSNVDDSLNPMQAGTSANGDLAGFMHGTLYQNYPGEDRISSYYGPELAAEMPVDVNGDGLVWQIKLHKDAKFANGDPITADTWLYSWKEAMSPKLANTYAVNIYKNYLVVKNGAEYFAQTAEAPVAWEDVGFKKIDDYTIEVTSTLRCTQVEVARHFASAYTAPVHPETYAKCLSADGTQCDYGSSLDKVVLSGAFKTDNWVKGSECVMVKNDLWVRADMIKLDGIKYRVVQDESTRLELFEKGECDSIALKENGLAKYGEDPRVTNEPTNTIRSIEINLNSADKPWLHDVRFRKAIYYSCDRTALAKLTNTLPAPYFFSTTTTGIPSTGTMFRDTAEGKANIPANNGYDPDLAKKLMAEVMKDYNLTKIEVGLVYNENVESARLCSEYQQKVWGDLFGTDKFEVKLSAMQTSAALKMMRATQKAPSAEWDMCWSHWNISAGQDYPAKRVTKYTTGDTTRYTNYTSEKLNNLYAEMLKDENRFDEQKMLKMYAEAEKIVLDEQLVVPVIQTQSFTLKSERLILPVDQYVTGFGWGTMFCDIKQ